MPDQLNGNVPQGTFGVSKGDQDPSGPAAYPISTPMGVVSPPNITTGGGSSSGGSSGGSSVGSKVLGGIGTIGGSVIGGPIGGAIGGVLGDVIGGLFAQGGVVQSGDPNNGFAKGGEEVKTGTKLNEFAEGGEVKQSPHQDALTIGYLVGAHHQKNYGGTPKTLTQAANDIKQLLGHQGDSQGAPQERGFASGGSTTQAADPTATAGAPQKSFNSYDDLAQYYGENTGDTSSLGGDNSSQSAPQSQQSSMPVSTPTTNTLYPTASTQGTTAQTDQTSINPDITRGSYKYASQGGYMNYADGGEADNRAPASNYSAHTNAIRIRNELDNPNATTDQVLKNSQDLRKELALKGLKGFATGGPEMQGQPQQPQQPLQAGQAFQGDGSVKGPGGPQDDAIPAKLSNGEFVMSAPATQFFGVDKLNQMNEKGKQGFMQMTQQVQDNQNPQGQSPGGAPGAEAQMAPPSVGMMQKPPQMPPQGAMKDGGSVLRTKGSGYMGL